MEERLQKILARMGIASRRSAEEIIAEGRVTVNGKTAHIGMKANPAKDHIKVDGKLLIRTEPLVYFAFNKPRGVVTSLSDPEGRPTVKDFLKAIKYRVYPVGRLDYDSEGLLIITNDGNLANAVMHPAKEIAKTYVVKVKGVVSIEAVEKLRKGIKLSDGITAPAIVKKIKETEINSWIEITIHEGKNRQVRRMLEKLRYDVLKLRRVSIGGLKLAGLESGGLRRLTSEELEQIKEAVGLA
ncbi:MAG: rRNA pseudouridine synthase [Nitrospirae bacterium]|nr:rRNA pseudouridine synthase [Nitrospirota bacterium]